MARESFDKEIQFLRMLVLTSGAYNRQQFAKRLGISVHTFDKTIRKLKEIASASGNGNQSPEEPNKKFAGALRLNYYDSADPLLLFLFRAKSLKESESLRLALLLAALHEKPQTALELLGVCCNAPDAADRALFPDEKTIRSDLRYLEEVGVIKRVPGPRPYRYRMQDDLVRQLTDEELRDLMNFVDVMANTQVPSVQGYLLRDHLKRSSGSGCVSGVGGVSDAGEPFLYKYHYYSRILDEAHLFMLLGAIQNRRKVSFLYFSPKSDTSYASKNTNPLFEREHEGRTEQALPIKVVYDHQYGRWYMLANNSRDGIRKYRLEGMTQIEEGEAVAKELFEEKRSELEARIKHSWLIDTGRAVTVRVRFFHPGGSEPNFVRDRVLLQGQWGQIVEEEDGAFIYEIMVNGTMEIRPWLRSFGSSCEVLAPAMLRREMIEEWKELASYYESV
ncbi:putative DNA-binding transcriptional regulator YafY [Paenibacillus taihuensis]|uniref:Putative DNA-binding transcriptional regulator YafY n=1 Tax=Paenibacillus taihuensis TaxID=1156355 RepID=A0A3D9PZ19_9BACL|nr:WYL domain-containing protein [Paenibacillus taihuensis]REE55390.1 putative DNA-binding transcriptional regulator YafY [Paenibacillus taihuensis]